MASDTPRLGFIGLGLMGTPIALRLLGAGHRLTVWGRNAKRLAPALAKGAVEARSALEVAATSDVIFLCLTDAAAVEEVVFGDKGIVAKGTADKVLVDHSTIDPGTTRALASRLLGAAGMAWVDAPVSGGPPAAERGALAVMAGGTIPAVARVTPLMQAYAARVTHMGNVGAGQTTKLINQALVGVNFMLIAEALGFARRVGIDAGKLPEAIRGGRADSNLLQEYWPRMLAPQAPVGGRVDILLKDLDLVAANASQAGAAMPLTRLAGELHRLVAALGHGSEDNAAVARLYDPAKVIGGSPQA